MSEKMDFALLALRSEQPFCCGSISLSCFRSSSAVYGTPSSASVEICISDGSLEGPSGGVL